MTRWLGGIAVAAAGLCAAGALAASGPDVGPIAGKDVVTGKPVSLDDYANRPVVVNFWAAWCGGCKTEARDLAVFVKGNPGLAIIGVDTNDSKPAARAFMRRYGFSYPSVWDPSAGIATRVGVIGLPTTLFLDRKHRLVATVVGAGTLTRFRDALRRVGAH